MYIIFIKVNIKRYSSRQAISRQVSFHESCGFENVYRIKNFFTDNYDHPMFE